MLHFGRLLSNYVFMSRDIFYKKNYIVFICFGLLNISKIGLVPGKMDLNVKNLLFKQIEWGNKVPLKYWVYRGNRLIRKLKYWLKVRNKTRHDCNVWIGRKRNEVACQYLAFCSGKPEIKRFCCERWASVPCLLNDIPLFLTFKWQLMLLFGTKINRQFMIECKYEVTASSVFLVGPVFSEDLIRLMWTL